MASEAHNDVEKAAAMAEKQPLLEEGSAKEAAYGGKTTTRTKEAMKHRFMSHGSEVQDAMTYQAKDLAKWSSLLMLSYTVWNRHSLWSVTFKLLGVSSVIALLVLFTVPDPAQLKVSKFTAISTFLRVFVGFLLGFFMSASVQRWWSCAHAFHNLCASIRTFHIWLNSLGLPEEHKLKLLRYAVSSAWILNNQLYVEALPLDEQDRERQDRWKELEHGVFSDSDLARCSQEELDVLKDVADPSGTLWMWMGSYIGHLATEGIIPGFTTGTYAKLMGLIAESFNAIRDVHSAVSTQAPFIYVQMLASLVHINNIISAISFGLTSGAAIAVALVHWEVYAVERDRGVHASSREAVHDAQTLFVSFFLSCFGPFVYQALLEVSIAIAQPFSNKDAVVPTERMVRILQKDLTDEMHAAKKITWTQPSFHKPAT